MAHMEIHDGEGDMPPAYDANAISVEFTDVEKIDFTESYGLMFARVTMMTGKTQSIFIGEDLPPTTDAMIELLKSRIVR